MILPIVPVAFMTSLGHVFWPSLVGLITTFIAVFMTYVYCAFLNLHPIIETINFENVIGYSGAAIFLFEGNNAILVVRNGNHSIF